jgi:Histidine kinase-like ATPase domain
METRALPGMVLKRPYLPRDNDPSCRCEVRPRADERACCRNQTPVQVSAPASRFPDTVEATAYFVVTEAITNAARHAAASVVRVEVTAEDGELMVRVSDDGSAAPTPPRPPAQACSACATACRRSAGA